MVKSRGKSFTCSMQKTTHQAWPTFGDFLGFELSIASQEKLQVGLLPKASFIGHLSLEVREQGYLRAKLSALKLDKQITQSKWGKASKVGKIVRSSLSHPTPPSLLHLNCGNCTRLQSPVALLNQEHPLNALRLSLKCRLRCTLRYRTTLWVITTAQYIRRILPFPLQGPHHKRPSASHHIASPLEPPGGWHQHAVHIQSRYTCHNPCTSLFDTWP